MIVTIDGIPVYQATMDGDDTRMLRISLVDDPAVQSDFLKFSAQPPRRQLYSVTDEEKRLVRGVVMRADFPIYRRDERMGEYYIIYKADTIRTMAEKYLVEGRQNDVNLMHEEGSDVDGVQLIQWFLKDAAAGISPEGFDDIADGSLFAEFHIVNDDVWAAVKAGTYKGFSLEGIFDLVPETDADSVLGRQRDTELVLRHMAKPRTNLKCIPQEIDALYLSGSADSITAAFAVSSILVLFTIILLILRCILENRAKKAAQSELETK